VFGANAHPPSANTADPSGCPPGRVFFVRAGSSKPREYVREWAAPIKGSKVMTAVTSNSTFMQFDLFEGANQLLVDSQSASLA
jgi:hypothetical protein